jgi:hypothetical protein
MKLRVTLHDLHKVSQALLVIYIVSADLWKELGAQFSMMVHHLTHSQQSHLVSDSYQLKHVFNTKYK